MNKVIPVLIISAFLFCFCSGRKPAEKDEDAGASGVMIRTDSTYLFDGETLEGWAITNFGPQGPVYVSGGSIILGAGEGCTGITWKEEFPETDYRVTLQARRVSGNDFFCGMTFPVGIEYCSLIVGGWGGTVVGLSSVNMMDASENETTTLMKFEKDHWYNICLMVKEDTIKTYIDNVLVIDFAKGNKALSVRPEVELSKPFGITSWNTTAALRNIRLERLSRHRNPAAN